MGRDSWHGLRGVDCGLNDIRRRGQGAELSPAMRPKKRIVEPPNEAAPAPAPEDVIEAAVPVEVADVAEDAAPPAGVEAAPALLPPPAEAVFSPLVLDDESVDGSADDPSDAAEVVETAEETPRVTPRRYGLRYLGSPRR